MSTRVLVIDDDAAHAESIGEALETFGYEPRVVHSVIDKHGQVIKAGSLVRSPSYRIQKPLPHYNMWRL